jgi:hypothetical protein
MMPEPTVTSHVLQRSSVRREPQHESARANAARVMAASHCMARSRRRFGVRAIGRRISDVPTALQWPSVPIERDLRARSLRTFNTLGRKDAREPAPPRVREGPRGSSFKTGRRGDRGPKSAIETAAAPLPLDIAPFCRRNFFQFSPQISRRKLT